MENWRNWASLEPDRHRRRSLKSLSAALAATLSLAIAGTPALGADEPLVEKLGPGEVDWSKKVVLATGSGAPNLQLPNVAAIRLNAERAAKLDAYRNILETLRGVRISGPKTANEVLADGELRARVEGTIRGCKIVDTRYYSDGGVEVVVRCPLDGAIGAALAPPGPKSPARTQAASKHTGLIVDASGLGLAPSLRPAIGDSKGETWFAAEMVADDALASRGVAAFARNLQAAKSDPRVGKNPAVVRATALSKDQTGVIVSDEKLAELSKSGLGYLAEARVIFVTGGK